MRDVAGREEVGGDASFWKVCPAFGADEIWMGENVAGVRGAMTLTGAESVDDCGSQPMRYRDAGFGATSGGGKIGEDVGGVSDRRAESFRIMPFFTRVPVLRSGVGGSGGNWNVAERECGKWVTLPGSGKLSGSVTGP